MLVPVVSAAEEGAQERLSAYGIAGTVLLDAGSASIERIVELLASSSAPCYVRAALASVEDAVRVLDAGAHRIVVEAGSQIANALPADRCVLTGSAAPAPADASLLVSLATATAEAAKALRGDRRARLLVEGVQAADTATIAALDAVGADVVAVADAIGAVSSAFVACAKSDRPDGLFTTVVVDEQGVALGLVYSNAESVREAFAQRRGVYYSRSRSSLWFKGDSSGATQTLLFADLDCDRDCIRFVVRQHGAGFCHLETRNCFSTDAGIGHLMRTIESRRTQAPAGSYTRRLFDDPALLASKIMEEAKELCDATQPADVAWEAADLIYFALTKCAVAGVSLADVEEHLRRRSLKVTRRPGDAKPAAAPAAVPSPAAAPVPEDKAAIRMQVYDSAVISAEQRRALLQRPIAKSDDITARIRPIREAVLARGDAALVELTAKFDRVQLTSPVIDLKAPGRKPVELDPAVKASLDLAMANVRRFHAAQLPTTDLEVETMPGVTCSRFVRPIERVGLYVPGGSAVLPSTAYMLGIPAQVAGCREIVIATPPRPDGTVVPEVEYVAEQIGASQIVLAGGAQAIFAMAYGTQSVKKVDKICGPGNQYVTAAKMLVQNDSDAMVSIDMPAGPSEVLVIATAASNPAYVASDLLSQAEHGPDSQVVLLAVDMTDEQLERIAAEVERQGEALPRADICRQSIPKSFALRVKTMEEAIAFSNEYAPEHLIVSVPDAKQYLGLVTNAGSVFLGEYSSESCGDYASGTNHTLPTYGYARMYSGVNTATFLKHITSQHVTARGLDNIGDAVVTLARAEGLEGHANSVVLRLADIRTAGNA